MTRRSYGVLGAAVFTLLLLLFLYSVAEILLLLFIAVLFSLYLSTVTDALQRRFGVPRPLGLTTALVATALALVGMGYLIVPPLATQTQELIAALPALLERWEADLRQAVQRSRLLAQLIGPVDGTQSYVGNLVQGISRYFHGFVPYVFSGVHFLIQVVSVLIMGVYLALRPALYRDGFILLAPPVHRELVRDILADLGETLRAWILGQLLAMTILGVLTWIGLELLGVPYALAFGVFTGAVAIVPFFGTLVSTLLPALFVLGTGGLIKALLVAALGVGVHLIEANVVAPMIMERQVQLPPVLTLLSVLVMGHLLGAVGLLVAVPVLATVMVVVRRIYVQRILEGKGFRRAIRDQPLEVKLPAEGVLAHPEALATTVPAMLEH
ncbi:MAG TPA: AI-2E family transporter [Longimicrobiales bacterium]